VIGRNNPYIYHATATKNRRKVVAATIKIKNREQRKYKCPKNKVRHNRGKT